MNNTEFVELVRRSREDAESFAMLVLDLRPILHSIARRLRRDMIQDLEQEGSFAVWNEVVNNRTVDLDRPTTVRPYLIRCASNRMKSYLRRRANEIMPVMDLDKLPSNKPFPICLEVEGILRLYLMYARMENTMVGAHAWVADQLGVTTSAACTLFHKAAKKYREKQNDKDH